MALVPDFEIIAVEFFRNINNLGLVFTFYLRSLLKMSSLYRDTISTQQSSNFLPDHLIQSTKTVEKTCNVAIPIFSA